MPPSEPKFIPARIFHGGGNYLVKSPKNNLRFKKDELI